jgi:hypothetical protein
MLRGKRMAGGFCLAALVLCADLAVVAARFGDQSLGDAVAASAAARPQRLAPTTTTTAPPAPPPTEPAPPPTDPPTTTTTTAPPLPSYVDPARPGMWSVQPYQGLGVWLDVYDWTGEFTNGNARVGLEDIDRMAAVGIQTIFIQTSHRRSPEDVIERDRLLAYIDRAHADGMSVVGWYLPMLDDLAFDLRRLVAAVEQLPIDGLGVDIESLSVKDPAERTRRLLALSTELRNVLGPRAIAAITQSAVVMQVVNPGYWPGFPWPEIGQLYDAVVPMSYWSERKPEWKSGERVVAEDIDRIRASTGRPDMPIHVAGGIANGVSLDDLRGMVSSILTRQILGGSLYDWNTSQPDQWDLLRALRVG